MDIRYRSATVWYISCQETKTKSQIVSDLTTTSLVYSVTWALSIEKSSCATNICALSQVPWDKRSWDKSKKPCICVNRTFSNSVHHQNLESIQPATLCFPDPDDAPHWESQFGTCPISAQAWVLAIFCTKPNPLQ